MTQEVEIEICIELINLIENQSISNEYIIKQFQKEKYFDKAIEL